MKAIPWKTEVSSACGGEGSRTNLGDVGATAGDDSSHQVVVATEVLGSAVVDNVCAVLERSLEVRAHHRVVDDYERLGLVAMNKFRNSGNVGDLEERVRRSFEEDHGDLGVGVGEDGEEGRWDGGVDVVGVDPVVRLQVAEETVRPAVEVVAGDDLLSRLEETEDDIESAHSGRDGERVLSRGDFRDVVLCVSYKGGESACVPAAFFAW